MPAEVSSAILPDCIGHIGAAPRELELGLFSHAMDTPTSGSIRHNRTRWTTFAYVFRALVNVKYFTPGAQSYTHPVFYRDTFDFELPHQQPEGLMETFTFSDGDINATATDAR